MTNEVAVQEVRQDRSTLHERLETLVNQLPDIESTIESRASLRDVMNSVGKGPLVEELKNPSAFTLAPWTGLFLGECRNASRAFNYGFVLGLRFAHEEQIRSERFAREEQIRSEFRFTGKPSSW
jgi:hypothetical protein